MNHFYKNIPGWFSYATFYESMVDKAKSGARFVEIGCWKGRSTAHLATEIKNSGKDIEFICVDHFQGSNEDAHQKDPDIDRLYDVFMHNVEPVKDQITVYAMPSTEAAKNIQDHSVDFLCLDGAHDYESVNADLLAWLPKMKPGSTILFDDARWSGVKENVYEFFDHKIVNHGGSGKGTYFWVQL